MRSKITSSQPTNTDLFDAAFLQRIERLTLQARRYLRGGLIGEHASRRRLPAPTFSDHRRYSHGDDLRHIDWPAYARQDELHVKLGETEQEINVIIALDRSASLDWGTGDQHKGRYALRLAALIGHLALAANDHTQVWPFDTHIDKPFGPASSRARGPDLLRYLATINWHGTTSLDAVTDKLRKYTGGLLVLISDLWSGGDLDALLRAAAPPRWQVVVLHLLHPEEVKPAFRGLLEIEDLETGATVPLDVNDVTLEAYRQRINNWVRTAERTCTQRGATYAGVRTDRSLERAILPFLRRRRILT